MQKSLHLKGKREVPNDSSPLRGASASELSVHGLPCTMERSRIMRSGFTAWQLHIGRKFFIAGRGDHSATKRTTALFELSSSARPPR